LSGVKVEHNARQYRLQFPDGWLERRPLTRKALEEEAAYWKALGVRYSFI
jgi:exopolyphosphatase/guanosine-5'-triphosphate,3'-diphosphate pyrophosphatase